MGDLADLGVPVRSRSSLKRLAVGFAIAAAIGIGLGLLVGASRAPDERSSRSSSSCGLSRRSPSSRPRSSSSASATRQRIAVIAFGLCFPILVNTAEGVRVIPPEVRDTASMLHVGRVERIWRIYFPSALPSIMAGLRIAVSIGLVLVVVSEFVGEGNGLGHCLLVQQSLLAVPEMYAGILFLGLLGYILNRLFLVVERRVLAWHYGAAGE